MFDILFPNPNQNNQIGMKNIQRLYMHSREAQTDLMKGLATKASIRFPSNRYEKIFIQAD